MKCPKYGHVIGDRNPELVAKDIHTDIIAGIGWEEITKKYFKKIDTIKNVTYNNQIIENINNTLPDGAYKFALYSVVTINGKLPQEL